MSLQEFKKDLRSYSSKKRAKSSAWFFKTGKGQYGEGDVFLGVSVPHTRIVVRKHIELSLSDISLLLKSSIHEERLSGVLLLVGKYNKGTDKEKVEIYKFYIKNTKYINNWDIVDSSAPCIVGVHLLERDKKILLKLAKSKSLWEKRIAIVATLHFIISGESKWTFDIVKLLMSDSHDLIHKACGWMLREVGKRVSEEELLKFLDIYATTMPRTMLRYAIERLPENKRKHYLHAK